MKSILSDIDSIIKDAAERNTDEIEDVQTSQMQKGKNSDGGNIGKLRSPAYSQRKKNRGGDAPFGVVDLKNTGKFQRAVFAKVGSGGVLIDSKDSKRNELVKKYGENIFGFNDNSKENLKTVFVPTIIFQIRRDIL